MENNFDHFELFSTGTHRGKTENIHISFLEPFERNKFLYNDRGITLSLKRKITDAGSVSRLLITRDNLSVEILPSKGFSIGEAFWEGRPFFWNPPLEGLPDPDTLDPGETIFINDRPMEGFGFLRAFTGGVEMLGLRNWGMPYRDIYTGRLFGLHGDISLTPVSEADITVSEAGIEISALVTVTDREGDGRVPWYKRGMPIFTVKKNVIIDRDVPGFSLIDEIRNMSGAAITPDWGYHVQLFPKPGARYLVPAAHSEVRGGEKNNGIDLSWKPSKVAHRREERGIIFKKIHFEDGLLRGLPGARTLFQYSDGRGILVAVPQSPFFMSWYSAGGEGGREFKIPATKGGTDLVPISELPWNGVGPEFGSSSLDHDGNVSTEIPTIPLHPGERLLIPMNFEMLERVEAEQLSDRILAYGKHS